MSSAVWVDSVSLFYLIGFFNLWDGLRTLVVSAAGAYAIARYVQGAYMPWIAFAYLMGHMLISHIERELHGLPGVVDVTGAQMVMVMKVGEIGAMSVALIVDWSGYPS